MLSKRGCSSVRDTALPGRDEAAEAGAEPKPETAASWGLVVQAGVMERASGAAAVSGGTRASLSAFEIFATSWARSEESLANVLPIPWRALWFRL